MALVAKTHYLPALAGSGSQAGAVFTPARCRIAKLCANSAAPGRSGALVAMLIALKRSGAACRHDRTRGAR